jgi:hypothetical protein
VPVYVTVNRATGRHVREDTRRRVRPRRDTWHQETRARVPWDATLNCACTRTSGVTELHNDIRTVRGRSIKFAVSVFTFVPSHRTALIRKSLNEQSKAGGHGKSVWDRTIDFRNYSDVDCFQATNTEIKKVAIPCLCLHTDYRIPIFRQRTMSGSSICS